MLAKSYDESRNKRAKPLRGPRETMFCGKDAELPYREAPQALQVVQQTTSEDARTKGGGGNPQSWPRTLKQANIECSNARGLTILTARGPYVALRKRNTNVRTQIGA